MAEPGQLSGAGEEIMDREHQRQVDAVKFRETLDPEQAEVFDELFSPVGQAEHHLAKSDGERLTHYGFMSSEDLGPVAESVYALIEAETEEREAHRAEDLGVRQARLAEAAKFRQRAQEIRAKAE